VRPELTRPLAAGLCGLSVGLLLGGAIGLLVGLAVGAGILRWLSGLETAAQRSEREQIGAALPLTAQLLAAAVSAGVAPGLALDAVADALDGPLGERLRSGRRAEVLGVPPEGAWAELLRDPTTRGLGRVLAQSSASGLAPAAALLALAEDVQREARLRADSAARSVGAKVAAPLGLCFLPAFVLCGIVPLIASTASTLLP
jgi:pilus assembly protein TadC